MSSLFRKDDTVYITGIDADGRSEFKGKFGRIKNFSGYGYMGVIFPDDIYIRNFHKDNVQLVESSFRPESKALVNKLSDSLLQAVNQINLEHNFGDKYIEIGY